MKKDRGSRTMPLLIRAIDCCSFDDNAVRVSGADAHLWTYHGARASRSVFRNFHQIVALVKFLFVREISETE